MSEPIGVRVEDVSMRYETFSEPVTALSAITIEVEPGRSVAITGPSGCGKSTLLGLIGGLDTPTSGRILVGDAPISSLPERPRAELRRYEMGFIFQADNLLPFLTVVENVALQLALTGDRDGGDRCLALLARLGIADQADKLPDQLSGGQRQRAAVARALIHEPRLILADEPTGELDAENSEAVLELLLDAQARLGATLVVVTHDPRVASRLDRTIALRDGRVAEKDAVRAS